MDFFDKYSKLEKQFEILCRTRRDEILSHIIETDSEYESLRRNRADASMVLKEVLGRSNADRLFEEYSDAVYAQEVYELDTIYRQALYDALEAVRNQGIL